MATENRVTLEDYRPFDPATLSCPHAAWAMLRQADPVHRISLPHIDVPVFLVTRRRDIEYVTKHPELFSNVPIPSIWRWGDFEPPIAQAFAKCGRKVVQTLQASDPPVSIIYRQFLMNAINARKLEQLAPSIDSTIGDLLSKIPADRAVNFVEAFSVPFPLRVICLILGIPEETAEFFRYYSDEFTHLIDPTHSTERAVKAAETVAEGYRLVESYLEKYRRVPADNLLSAYANARMPDGRLVTMEEAISLAHVTIIAGNETTRNALSSAMLQLARRPETWSRLKADAAAIPGFVEEVLRADAPATTTPRTALCDTEIAGVSIPKGSCVFVIWGSGSRDESGFERPEEFNIDRQGKRIHLSFGSGIHMCAGSGLARAELNAAVTQWARHFDTLALAVPEEQIHYEPVFGFRALNDLPIRLTRVAETPKTPSSPAGGR